MAVTICQFVSYLFSANICVFNKSGKEKDSATENNSNRQKGVDLSIEECDIVCMVSLPDKVWEFDEVVAKTNMRGAHSSFFAYRRFIERELLKHGEVAVSDRWLGNISYWRIPFPGVYNPETGQVW